MDLSYFLQGILLQIFTQPVSDRPTVFLEIIQRLGCVKELHGLAAKAITGSAKTPIVHQAGGCGMPLFFHKDLWEIPRNPLQIIMLLGIVRPDFQVMGLEEPVGMHDWYIESIWLNVFQRCWAWLTYLHVQLLASFKKLRMRSKANHCALLKEWWTTRRIRAYPPQCHGSAHVTPKCI